MAKLVVGNCPFKQREAFERPRLVLPASLLQSLEVGLLVIITTQAPDHVASETLFLQGIAGLPHTLAVLPGPESRVLDLGIKESRSLGNRVVVVDIVEGNIIEGLDGVSIGSRLASDDFNIMSLGGEVVLGLESECARSTTINSGARRSVVGFCVASFRGKGIHLHGVEFASARVLDSITGLGVLDVEPLGVAENNEKSLLRTTPLFGLSTAPCPTHKANPTFMSAFWRP